MQLYFQNATPAHIPDILSVAVPSWQKTYEKILSDEQRNFMCQKFYHPDALLQLFEVPQHFTILAYDELKPIAFATMMPTDENKILKISRLYLLPEAQGKGFGHQLMQQIIKEACSKKYQILTLNVNRYNQKALDFYLKEHFVIVSQQDIPFEHFVLNDYIMQRTL